jgi:hypothetical protein
MTERRKGPHQSSPWVVEALFELPLAARQVLVTKYQLPVASDDLILPSDEKQSVVQLANTIAIDGDAKITPEENLANTAEFTTTVLSPADDLEADALRALMGYGRLARRKDGSHEC